MSHDYSASGSPKTDQVSNYALQQAKLLERQGSRFVSLLDEDGIFRYLSPAHFEFYGFAESQMVGHNFEEFIIHDDVAHMRLALQDTLLNDESVKIGLRVLTANGAIVRIRGSARRIISGDGSCLILGNSTLVKDNNSGQSL